MYEPQYQKAYGQSVLAMAIGMIVLMVLFVWGIGHALDQGITNQDTMLCSSAKISGNSEYLQKCGTYYQTGNPKDIEGGR